MSRTYKDVPQKHVNPEADYWFDYETIRYEKFSEEFQYWYTTRCLIQKPGLRTKKKRNYKEYHWMSTPMWWIREMMNQPQRTKGRQWEKSVLKVNINDLDIIDYPSVSRKPHLYYW